MLMKNLIIYITFSLCRIKKINKTKVIVSTDFGPPPQVCMLSLSLNNYLFLVKLQNVCNTVFLLIKWSL